ncbi:MAG: hypothetical protein ACOC0U_03800 [Desulfovibrionales bacterium]
MTPEEIRAMMAYLRERVHLDPDREEVAITFSAPTEEEMLAAGLNAGGVNRVRNASWWEEMVRDIIETPDFCDPGDPLEQVLEYARDVITDSIRKRYQGN